MCVCVCVLCAYKKYFEMLFNIYLRFKSSTFFFLHLIPKVEYQFGLN